MNIDSEKLKSAMFDAVAKTFEAMAFLEVTHAEQKITEAEIKNWFWAKVTVKKPFIGEMTLKCPKELVEEITTLMYGAETEINDATVFDAMAEFANTIVGRCMNTILPEDKGFELYVPETGIGAHNDGENNLSCDCVVDSRFNIQACFTLIGHNTH